MRILIAHNRYRSNVPSGENIVCDAEIDLLKKNGHVVKEFFRNSDALEVNKALGYIKGAAATPWNFFSFFDLRKKLEEENFDIVHVHNTFPMLSPSIFRAARGRAARVLTLHNYRLFCPAAMPMRNGQVCTECISDGNALAALKYGCYRNSKLATFPLFLNVELNRVIGTWKHEIDAFIVLSEFQKSLMIGGGLPSHKVHIKPNFYPGFPEIIPWENRKNCIVFVGRLSQEKGVVNLLKAWKNWGENAPELIVIGDGCLKVELEREAHGLPIKFLGQIEPEDAQKKIAESKLLILPSEWFEGFPMVLREAFAFGTPVAVSDIGPLSSIAKGGECGCVFKPSNPLSLRNEVMQLWHDEQRLKTASEISRKEFELNYTESANYNQMMLIYRNAIEVASND